MERYGFGSSGRGRGHPEGRLRVTKLGEPKALACDGLSNPRTLTVGVGYVINPQPSSALRASSRGAMTATGKAFHVLAQTR